MILGFKQYFDKQKQKPTYFKEKILSGVKIHSIRDDVYDRWDIGNKIHMAYGVRTPYYECFCQEKCQNIEAIIIEEMAICNSKHCITVNNKIYKVTVNNDALLSNEIELLSYNDGFDNVGDFFNWFGGNNKKRKIIHWTDSYYRLPYEQEKNNETFICRGCGHNLPADFQMRTKDYCYLCDPNITVDELLNDTIDSQI